MPCSELDSLVVNTIKTLAMDAVQKANSGHPGMPMGTADAASVLWRRFLTVDPEDPAFPNRDRFILSAGHGSMLLYALLHLSGHELSLDEIKRFRQLGSKTPATPRSVTQRGLRPRPARSARASATVSVWPWQRPSSRRTSTGLGTPSSTT